MRALLLSILLLVALSALATVPLTFEEADIDGDGLISADEAAGVDGLDFTAADADADGTLSVDEYDIAVEDLSQPPEILTEDDNDAPMAPSPAAPPAD